MATKYNTSLPRPSHHLILTDGDGVKIGLISVDAQGGPDANTIGRNQVETTALKTATGNQEYSDLQPPYAAMAQDDWSGGRAGLEFEKDTTRFRDSRGINSERSGRLTLGPREHYASRGLFTYNSLLPGSLQFTQLFGDRKYLAQKFTTPAGYSTTRLFLWVRYWGTPTSTLYAYICADSGGSPGGPVIQINSLSTTDLASERLSELFVFTITSTALTGSTNYWLELVGNTNDDADNCWEVGTYDNPGSTGLAKESDDGSTWTARTDLDIYYRFEPAPTVADEGFYFEYKKAMYFVTSADDGSTAPKLYLNGARGACLSNSGALDKLKAGGSPGWTTNEFVGCIALIVYGPGIQERRPWRTITANTSSELTVDEDWVITHTTDTSFVILGSDKWTEITGHGMAKPVTDVLVASNAAAYFCFGYGNKCMTMIESNATGTWTRTFSTLTGGGPASGDMYPEFMAEFRNMEGKQKLAANNSLIAANGINTYWGIADVPASGGTAPTYSFLSYPNVGDSEEPITGMIRYVDDDEEDAVWIFKEGSQYITKQDYDTAAAVVNILDLVKLPEYKTVRFKTNGRRSAVLGSYLYFTTRNTVNRYAKPNLDDIGYNLFEFLPEDRHGEISDLMGYAGRLFVAIDAGSSGYSSVYSNIGGSAWHELYRAPKGERITAMAFQPMPGSLDRMWIRQGNNMIWLGFPNDSFDPYFDPDFEYTHEGVIELTPMFANLKDAYKFWRSVKTYAENLASGTTWIEVDYKLDDEATWHYIGTPLVNDPIDLFTLDDVHSKKIQFRLRFYSTDVSETPLLRAFILTAVAVTEPKYSYALNTKVDVVDLNNEPDDDYTPVQRIRKLDEWAGTARPLTMTCINPLYDGIDVFLLPLPARPLLTAELVNEFAYLVTIVVQEA